MMAMIPWEVRLSPGYPRRGQALWFARLAQVLGAVAQSGSAPRSHRGGQGFKSPQLHRVLAGQSLFCGWLPVAAAAAAGAKSHASGMAEAIRRDHGNGSRINTRTSDEAHLA